jgi:hypothetical protein
VKVSKRIAYFRNRMFALPNSLPIKVYQDKFTFVFLAVLLKAVLSVLIYTMSFKYGYYGVIFDPREIGWQMISFVFFVLVALTIRLDVNRASNVLHALLFICCFVPISAQHDMNEGFDGLVYFSLIGTFLLIGQFTSLVRIPRVGSSFQLTRIQFVYMIVTLCALSLGILVAKFGIELRLPAFDELYDQRDLFKEERDRISQYAFGWMGNVINIALILYGLRKRNLVLVLAGMILSVYLFSLGGHKSVLLVAPLSIIVYVLFTFTRRRFILSLVFGLTTLCFFLLLGDLMYNDTTIASSIAVRRGLLLPAQIFYHYADYFLNGTSNYFSQNLPFSLFMTSPYTEPLPQIIGREYFGFIDDVYANGNVFADAVAQVGWFAFPFLAIVLPGLYAIIDKVSYGKDRSFVVVLMFIGSFTLVNSGLIVSLITHGLLLSILIVTLYPKKRYHLVEA